MTDTGTRAVGEPEDSMWEPCGAGHHCCDEVEGPPLHDHFLTAEQCPRCKLALRVENDARRFYGGGRD